MEKHLVTLRGGEADGAILAVEPTRLKLAMTYERGEREYAEGEWGEDSAAFVSRLVGVELYERVDADTFQVAA